MLRAAAERFARDSEARLYAAWVTASLTMTAFHAPKDFPEWDRIRPRDRSAPVRQSAEDIKAIARMWNAAAGGTLEKR